MLEGLRFDGRFQKHGDHDVGAHLAHGVHRNRRGQKSVHEHAAFELHRHEHSGIRAGGAQRRPQRPAREVDGLPGAQIASPRWPAEFSILQMCSRRDICADSAPAFDSRPGPSRKVSSCRNPGIAWLWLALRFPESCGRWRTRWPAWLRRWSRPGNRPEYFPSRARATRPGARCRGRILRQAPRRCADAPEAPVAEAPHRRIRERARLRFCSQFRTFFLFFGIIHRLLSIQGNWKSRSLAFLVDPELSLL